MNVEIVTPWDVPEWDAYVKSHPGATPYHTSAWIRTVCQAGRYAPVCLAVRNGSGVRGLLPAVEIRSRLTGNRMCTLSFSDECSALADDADAALALVDKAKRVASARGLATVEVRGAPTLRDESEADALMQGQGFQRVEHFDTFVLQLEADAEAVRSRLHKKAVRPTIKRAFKLGVTVREHSGRGDIREFYRMYCLTRRRHGVPPQPITFFEQMLGNLSGQPKATLYLAEHDGSPVSAIIVIRFGGATYLKYEVVDDRFRELRPVYALLWQSIEDACAAGDRVYDFGRTERDNEGLSSFKSRWGTETVELPYYFYPPGAGLSVVQSDDLKYRVFTAVFRRLPLRASAWIGARIFRHFG